MHLYAYFAQEVHRDWVARIERDAERRRLLRESGDRSPHATHSIPRLRRRHPHGGR